MVSIKLHSAVGSGCNTKTFDIRYGNGWNPKNSKNLSIALLYRFLLVFRDLMAVAPC